MNYVLKIFAFSCIIIILIMIFFPPVSNQKFQYSNPSPSKWTTLFPSLRRLKRQKAAVRLTTPPVFLLLWLCAKWVRISRFSVINTSLLHWFFDSWVIYLLSLETWQLLRGQHLAELHGFSFSPKPALPAQVTKAFARAASQPPCHTQLLKPEIYFWNLLPLFSFYTWSFFFWIITW